MNIHIQKINVASTRNPGSFLVPKLRFPFFRRISNLQKIRKVGWRQKWTQEYSPLKKRNSFRKTNAEGANLSIRSEKRHVFISKFRVFPSSDLSFMVLVGLKKFARVAGVGCGCSRFCRRAYGRGSVSTSTIGGLKKCDPIADRALQPQDAPCHDFLEGSKSPTLIADRALQPQDAQERFP